MVCSTPLARSPDALSHRTLSPCALSSHALSLGGLSENVLSRKKFWSKSGFLDEIC